MKREIEIDMNFSKTNADSIETLYWTLELEELGYKIKKVSENNSSTNTYYDTSDFHFFNTEKEIRVKEERGVLTGILTNLNQHIIKEILKHKNHEEIIAKLKKHDHLIKYIENSPSLISIHHNEIVEFEKNGVVGQLIIEDVMFTEPSSELSANSSLLQVKIKGIKIKEVEADILNIIRKTNSYDEESYSNYYIKGMKLVKQLQKTKRLK